MSRRIRVNMTRWVCRMIGHRIPAGYNYAPICDRCGRFW